MNPLYLAVPIWAIGALLTFAFFLYLFWKTKSEEPANYNPTTLRQDVLLVVSFMFLALVWPWVWLGEAIFFGVERD